MGGDWIYILKNKINFDKSIFLDLDAINKNKIQMESEPFIKIIVVGEQGVGKTCLLN